MNVEKLKDYTWNKGEVCETCSCDVPLKLITMSDATKMKVCSLCYETGLLKEILNEDKLSPITFARAMHWLYANLKISNWMKRNGE